jgi:ADP-ribose pyrophosphatase
MPKTESADITRKLANLFSAGTELKKELQADDPRNTDNAWVETQLLHFDDRTGDATRQLKFGEHDHRDKRKDADQ